MLEMGKMNQKSSDFKQKKAKMIIIYRKVNIKVSS